MAVSAGETSNQDIPVTAKIEKDKSSEIQANSVSTMVKSEKKDRRKPELQIYVPGRGFKKHMKSEDNRVPEKKSFSDVTNPESNNSLNIESSSLPNCDSKITDKLNIQKKSSRNFKNRRPDIQVYMPKAKVASKVTGKIIASSNDCSSKWESEENDVSWKEPNSHCDRQNSPEVKTVNKYSKKDPNLMKNNRNNGQRTSVSPPVTSSWADQVEESDISNSRSSPDNKLCNSFSDENVHLQLSNSSSIKEDRSNFVKNQKSNKEDHRRQRNKRNHRRNDNLQVGAEDKISNYLEVENRSKPHSNSSVSKQIDESLRSGDKNSKGFRNASDERKLNTNSLDRVKSRQKNTLTNISDTKRYSPEYNELNPNLISNPETKFDRKKKEKESTLPPRFQKRKSPNLETSSSCRNGGGILKILVDHDVLDNTTEMFDKIHTPKPFPEPPQMFIHKQLFDPNNPSKPEIINIRSPVPLPHTSIQSQVSSHNSFQSPVSSHNFFRSPVPPSHSSIRSPVSAHNKMNPFYAAEPINTPYIRAPVASSMYIPPPQPLVSSNQQYTFCPNEIDSGTTTNGYLENSPSSLSVHSSQLNGMFQPSHTYPDIALNNHGKKRLKPIVEKSLREIVFLEKEISFHLAKDLMDSSNLNSLRQSRWKLQLRYENIILADSKYCAEKNPEHSLWKTVYHQVIENLRKKIEEDSTHSEEIKEMLLNIILEGTMFYENLLEKQQETYGFQLTKMLDAEYLNTSCLTDQLRCVLISVQKILIYLGDLARYKEQVSGTSNYGKARSLYLKAQQIAPKNGKPYHQLAILAINTKRKLDAVYYYMRSLAASNPFLSAKESLLSLFEEAKRKYESYEKKRQQENVSDIEVFDESTTERCEIWIKNDGSSTNCQAEPEKNIDACDLKKLSDVELNKRFVTSFLHVHGKLFTKVGMETFPDTLKNMLKEFYILLQRTPVPLTSSRLMQLLAINIFSVTNSSLKENGREHGGQSLLQEQALYTSMAMMSMVMDRCCMLHVAHKSAPDSANHLIGDDFAQLLPSVKVWTDWMCCQRYLWPPPSVQILEELNVKLNQNIWASFADLLSVLREIDTSDPVIMSKHTNGCEPIMLEEDSSFAGFVPLLGAIQNPAYAVPPYDKKKARHCLRISKIQFFGDYLCGVSPPYLEFHVESKRFVALVDNLSFEETYERNILLSADDTFREENLNDEFQDESPNRNSISYEVQVLKSRKEALSKAHEKQQKYQAQVQAVLHKHQSQRPITKVKPRYLVPDTNCFIDHLKHFKNILASTDFHLIIPLVVINELDGLARGTRGGEFAASEHSSQVTTFSREAIQFLEQQFASRHPHLRSITSKGSILDTISFRSEEMGQNKGSNDDLILTCCLNYCKDRAENYMPKNRDEPVTLFREVVLLTDDRNLRVKALAHHVPVRDLLSFLQWANS